MTKEKTMADLSLKIHRVGDFEISTFAYIDREGDIRFRAITKWIAPGITVLDTLHHHTREQAKKATSTGLKEISESILSVKAEMEAGRLVNDMSEG